MIDLKLLSNRPYDRARSRVRSGVQIKFDMEGRLKLF